MAKIARYNGNLAAFASGALGTERTVFGDVAQADTLDANVNADYLRGWAIVGANDYPTLEDFNALAYTSTQLISYLHQMGVAEYNAAQEYHTGSLCVYNGAMWQSTLDNNVGNAPGTGGWLAGLRTDDIGLTVQAYDVNTVKTNVATNFTAGLQKSGVDVATLGTNTFLDSQTIQRNVPTIALKSTPLGTHYYDMYANISDAVLGGFSIREDGSVVATFRNGRLGVGATKTNPLVTLDVAGTIKTNDVEVATKGANAYTGAQTPAVDNTLDFGDITHRWQDIYATNDVIQTSDARLKDNITDVNPLAAEALIAALRPRSFKWLDYDRDIYSTPEDGSEPELIDTVHHTYTRTHYGLIAQEFEQALISIGINPDDMAGFIYDPVADRYGVRYNELISPMLSVIQSLMVRVAALEAKL